MGGGRHASNKRKRSSFRLCKHCIRLRGRKGEGEKMCGASSSAEQRDKVEFIEGRYVDTWNRKLKKEWKFDQLSPFKYGFEISSSQRRGI